MTEQRQTRAGLDLGADPRGRGDATPPSQQQDWPGDEDAMRPAADHGETSYRGAARLDGRAALITGADSGIGRAVAIAFAREGADIAIAYYDEHGDAEETARWVRDAGRRAILLPGDLTSRDVCRDTVERAADELGRLDVVVNNAAFQWEEHALEDISAEQIERTFRTNIFACIWIAQAALEHLGAGGVILNTGSVTALDGNAGLIDYSATKGAIHTFTKSLAQAVADRGIRVCGVAPGPVWTPLIPATLDPDHVDRFGGDTLWKRPAQPIEIATSYVFLASDDARYYSGEILTPTGRAASR